MFVHDCQSKNMNFTREKERERDWFIYKLNKLKWIILEGQFGFKGVMLDIRMWRWEKTIYVHTETSKKNDIYIYIYINLSGSFWKGNLGLKGVMLEESLPSNFVSVQTFAPMTTKFSPVLFPFLGLKHLIYSWSLYRAQNQKVFNENF